MKYELPKLNYNYNALEPVIDEQTMKIHHTKHHQGYIDKTNSVLEKYDELADKKLEDIFQSLDSFNLDKSDRQFLINNGGGVLNHNLYFQIMGPNKDVDEVLQSQIEEGWGDVESFKQKFVEAAKAHFGSGWAWLVRNSDNRLEIYTTSNQDSPYLKGDTPLIGMDLWEHAYYLNYQNRKAEYYENWWKVVKII